jgi:hypothetical protein
MILGRRWFLLGGAATLAIASQLRLPDRSITDVPIWLPQGPYRKMDGFQLMCVGEHRIDVPVRITLKRWASDAVQSPIFDISMHPRLCMRWQAALGSHFVFPKNHLLKVETVPDIGVSVQMLATCSNVDGRRYSQNIIIKDGVVQEQSVEWLDDQQLIS